MSELGRLPDTDYWNRFQGQFFGVLRWNDMETLWQSLHASPENWYVYPVSDAAPDAFAGKQDFAQFLDAAEAVINKRRDRPSCGSIYVDDMREPAYIKIFDPEKMGTSCSCSSDPVLPRWIVSRMKPDSLPPPQPLKKPTIFQRLTGLAATG